MTIFHSLVAAAGLVVVSAAMTSATLAAGPDQAAAAAADSKKVSDLLFETKHIVNLPAGTELVYKFVRTPSDESRLGKGYSDNITVKIEEEAKDNKKNVLLQMYTGERARDPHRITDMDGNPILIVYLDNAVAHFREIAGGDRAYLKNMFSSKIGSAAQMSPVKITYKGETVDGQKVTVVPYEKDPARAKMRGYEGAVFTLVVSDKIPGFFAQMTSKIHNSNAESPNLDEVTTLEGVEEIK